MENQKLHYQSAIEIRRNSDGVPVVIAESEADLWFGQGYIQAVDRGMQLLLTRILGEGRACELLNDSPEMLEVDLFFRRMNWRSDASAEVAKLENKINILAQAYVNGINAAFEKSIPLEMKLLRYSPVAWRIEDSILLFRMIGYLSLQQCQADLERLVIELVQAGLSDAHLDELFDGKLRGFDRPLLEKVRLTSRNLPGSLLQQIALPIFSASNNWAVSGERSSSGMPLLASDPHLETNRLPNIWQEQILTIANSNRYLIGAGIPGVPGILIGRNHRVSWGATYSYMDGVDSWVEECREGKYRRGQNSRNDWLRFKERQEVIRRKSNPDLRAIFFENEHGTLEGNPHQEGFYLATRWSGGCGTGARSLESVFRALDLKSAEDGMHLFSHIETAWNWLLADNNGSSGNIGYQMSGLMPRRKKGWSGLYPLPGWIPTNDWKGFLPMSQLPQLLNPKEGSIATANNDLNSLGKASPINACQGPWRAARITKLLNGRNDLTLDDMRAIQRDLYSPQAAAYLEILRPLLPEGNDKAKILLDWDCHYTSEANGAWLFEKFYYFLLHELFEHNRLGGEVLDHLWRKTAFFVAYFSLFDAILLGSEDSAWFAGSSREELFGRALEKALHGPLQRWGEKQEILFKHILLGDSPLRFLRLNRGPFAIPGGRATISQGQIYQSGGRTSSFMPSLRMVADMAELGLHSSLAGGPSDRPFSRWYDSSLNAWLRGEFKVLAPIEEIRTKK